MEPVFVKVTDKLHNAIPLCNSHLTCIPSAVFNAADPAMLLAGLAFHGFQDPRLTWVYLPAASSPAQGLAPHLPLQVPQLNLGFPSSSVPWPLLSIYIHSLGDLLQSADLKSCLSSDRPTIRAPSSDIFPEFQTQTTDCINNITVEDFPEGTVDENPPYNAEDVSWIPGLGRFHLLQATKAQVP